MTGGIGAIRAAIFSSGFIEKRPLPLYFVIGTRLLFFCAIKHFLIIADSLREQPQCTRAVRRVAMAVVIHVALTHEASAFEPPRLIRAARAAPVMLFASEVGVFIIIRTLFAGPFDTELRRERIVVRKYLNPATAAFARVADSLVPKYFDHLLDCRMKNFGDTQYVPRPLRANATFPTMHR